ncbi:MAG TPA: TlpA disulfide reductase family protein [Pyrinomonadaceae bacterium]|nr:TlpA disulfide reductase family protein [Pyrinomonadaceae bacterium]
MKILLLLVLSTAAYGQDTPAKLEGQVVCCAECWAEADRTKVEFGTAEDLLKAKSCVEGGDPTLLAVREGDKFKLYQLATGKFRLPGKNWLEFVGKRVAIEGTILNRKETGIIRVDTLAVVAPSIAEQQASNTIGRQVDLLLKDLSGVEQSLAALKGRIVILNFWATYCIPCRKEMPDLAAIQNDFAPFGVQVIGVNTDDAEDRKKVLQFVRETKVNFPVWVDGSTTHMMRFGLGGALPGTVVIGKDGRVTKVISGVVDPVALRKDIEALLATAIRDTKDKEPARRAEVSAVPS